MLPKVESEYLGLARSHGEQGHMPGNMQGKRHACLKKCAPCTLIHALLDMSQSVILLDCTPQIQLTRFVTENCSMRKYFVREHASNDKDVK